MNTKTKCKLVLHNRKTLLGVNILYDKLMRKNIQNKINSAILRKIKNSLLIIKKVNSYKNPINNMPEQIEFSIIEDFCLSKINVKIIISTESINYINKRGLKYNLITKYISVYSTKKTIINSLQIDISGFNINHKIYSDDLFFPKGITAVSKLNIIILKIKKKK